LIALTIAAAGAGQLLLKAGATAAGGAVAHDALAGAGWARLLLDWRVVLGLSCWILSTLVYLVVLTRADLSLAYCLGSFNYVVVPVASRWLFGESLSAGRWAGIAIVFVGVAVTLWAEVSASAARGP
jgi:drug/metabolite transporter (DMT)-like permease